MSGFTVGLSQSQSLKNKQLDTSGNYSLATTLKSGVLERVPASDILVKQEVEKTKKNWITCLKDLFSTKVYKKDDCNLIRLQTDDMSQVLKDTIGDKKYRIATSGYSFDIDGYEHTTKLFLNSLDENLGKRNTGYVVPPSLDKGNLYDITTKVSGLGANNVMFVTTERYWDKYTDFDKFDEKTDLKKYVKTPVHVFPDTETYTSATANASNVLVCTGGRKVAVAEITEALKRKNKVVILLNKNLMKEVFDSNTRRVENAAEYFSTFISPERSKNHYSESENLDIEFIRTHQDRLKELVRVYVVDDDESIKTAAKRASEFIKSKTLYDYFPDAIK